jgi:hypothetical protein
MGTGYLKSMLPKIDYKDTKRLWFALGKPYSVISAPSHVFRAAILAQAPKWKYIDVYMAVLNQDELDYQSRWWLLNCLADEKRELALYTSREAAEQACAEQMVG